MLVIVRVRDANKSNEEAAELSDPFYIVARPSRRTAAEPQRQPMASATFAARAA